MQLTPLKHSSALQERRNQYMAQVRSTDRDKIKARTRKALLEHYAQIDINQLIAETSTESLDSEGVSRLVTYANQGSLKAVGHLGNLVIEGRLQPAFFEDVSLKPGFESRWLWLIEVLIDHEYCSLQLLDHCVKSLLPNKEEQTITGALSILYKIMKRNQTFIGDETAVLYIVSAAGRPGKTGNVACLLLSELMNSCSSQLQGLFGEGVIRVRMLESLASGMNRLDMKGRRMVLKVMNSFAWRKIYFRELDGRLMQMASEDRSEEMGDAFLEYFLRVVTNGAEDHMYDLIGGGLIVQMGNWKRIYREEGQEELHDMLIDLGSQIRGRTSESKLAKGIFRQLERMGLLDRGLEVETI